MPIPTPVPGVTVTEVASVQERARSLGVKLPEGIVALPSHFFGAESADELRYLSETLDTKAIFKAAGEPLALVEREDGKIPFVSNHDDTWVGPVLYFAAGAMTRNPELVKFAIGLIQKYVEDMYRAVIDRKRVKLAVVIEENQGVKTQRIEFDGPVEKLPEIQKFVKAMKK
jgi:hypothetical protein